MEEIIDVIKHLPKSKATGEDQIPAELLQHMGEEGLNFNTNITNDCYNTGILPDDFLQSTFVTIPKAPNTILCNEHRTISLISHASKILLQIMKRRITPLAEGDLVRTSSHSGKGKEQEMVSVSSVYSVKE